MERVIHLEIKFTNTTLAVVIGLLLIGALAALLWTTGVVVASPGAQDGNQPMIVTGVGALVGEKVNYQGRLEGASGPITMTFRLWEDETSTDAGDIIWEETKIVTPTGGLFNTQLGDATHLNQDDVYGQELWLGVTVGNDDEMVPRQEILPVPYALSLRPGASIVGEQAFWWALNVQNQSENGGWGIFAASDAVDGIGGYFSNSKNETAIYANGHVRQDLASDGLVKAAVFAYCDDNEAQRGIRRSFNNVGNSPIEFKDGAANGRCIIDFGFNVRGRYIVAVANVTGPTALRRCVTVLNSEATPNDEVEFFRNNCDTSGSAGDISILVY